MMRMLGVLLLSASGILCAALSVREQRRRLVVLDAWIGLVRYMRGQIDCFLTPANEILAARIRSFPAFCRPEKEQSLSGLLKSSAPYLSVESKEVLEDLIREGGTMYREEALRRCDYSLSELMHERERLSASLPGSIRTSVALSLSIPLGILILLW